MNLHPCVSVMACVINLRQIVLSLSPVAFPKLNYAMELGIRFSQYAKSGQYLIQVAQEMIGKRRDTQRDAAYVKVRMVYTLSAKQNESVNRPLHYSIVFNLSFMNLN